MRKGPVLGIDFGTASIGLAISDDDAVFGVPLGAIRVSNLLPGISAEDEIGRICADRAVRSIVIGLPLNDDMSESALAKNVREFAAKIENYSGLPVYFEDEYLSTFQADILLNKKKGITKADRDSVAAQIILQNFLKR